MAGYIVVGGPASGGSGLVLFFTAPALATAATYLLWRRRTSPAVRRHAHPSLMAGRRGRHRAGSVPARPRGFSGSGFPSRPPIAGSPTHNEVLVLGGIVAALFWWVGVSGYLAAGGAASNAPGLALFLGIPAAVTAGVCLAWRRRRRRRSRA